MTKNAKLKSRFYDLMIAGAVEMPKGVEPAAEEMSFQEKLDAGFYAVPEELKGMRDSHVKKTPPVHTCALNEILFTEKFDWNTREYRPAPIPIEKTMTSVKYALSYRPFEEWKSLVGKVESYEYTDYVICQYFPSDDADREEMKPWSPEYADKDQYDKDLAEWRESFGFYQRVIYRVLK